MVSLRASAAPDTRFTGSKIFDKNNEEPSHEIQRRSPLRGNPYLAAGQRGRNPPLQELQYTEEMNMTKEQEIGLKIRALWDQEMTGEQVADSIMHALERYSIDREGSGERLLAGCLYPLLDKIDIRIRSI